MKTVARVGPTVRINPEFNEDPENPISVDLLADTSLQEWVHSLPEILAQGRTRFWRPPGVRTRPTGSEDEEHEDTDESSSSDNELQIPAPLLQPIGDDRLSFAEQSPWSIGLTMSVMREYSMCYVRSNVWPGAFTLGHAKYSGRCSPESVDRSIFRKHLNLYVGWGQKYESFHPSQPPLPMLESMREFLEKTDPSVEVEKAFEEAHHTIASDEYSGEDTEDQDEEEEDD